MAKKSRSEVRDVEMAAAVDEHHSTVRQTGGLPHRAIRYPMNGASTEPP